MILKTLCSLFLFHSLVWARLQQHEFENGIVAGCLFVSGDQEFDLCPLVKRRNDIFVESYSAPGGWTESGQDRSRTRLRNSSVRNLTENDLRQCIPGTWICMIEAPTNHQGSLNSYPINVGNIPDEDETRPFYKRPNAVATFNRSDGSLTLTQLIHGFSEEGNIIKFICDHETDEHSSPRLLDDSHNTLSLQWTTPHACSRKVSASPDIIVLETDIPGDDEESDDTKLVDKMPISDSQRRSMITILLLTGSGIAVLAFLIYSPPASLRHFIDVYVKPMQFRVGEGRLVRWAHEDLGALGDEEDIMVNGMDEEEDFDESIPLKPSPRYNFVANYGSAPL